jgi:dihydrofolate reductase
MGTISTGFSMSLDGFIAGPNDEVDHVFAWMSRGDVGVDIMIGDDDMELKMSAQSAELVNEASQQAGVLVVGRRLFDITGAWGGKHPLNVPMVVLTHGNIPQEWDKPPFTFVTDGLESAFEKAQGIAGEKKVVIASPSLVQQALKLGVLEEIHIDLVHILLGEGIPLFGHLGIDPLELKNTSAVNAPGVTHLTFSVIK